MRSILRAGKSKEVGKVQGDVVMEHVIHSN